MNPYLLLAAAVAVVLGIWATIKTSRDLVFGLAIIFFCLPFERIPTLEVADFTLKINHLLGILVIILWLVDRLVFRRTKIISNPLTITSLLFSGALILSVLNADFVGRGIIFTVLSIFTIILALITVDCVRTWHAFQKIEKAVIASAWLVLVFSLWQYLGDLAGLPLGLTGLVEGYSKITFGFPRVQAFSKEPLYLGNLLFLPLGLLIGRLLSGESKRISDQVLVLGLILVFFLTLSRGAFVGLAAFGLALGIFNFRKVITLKNILLAVAALALALVIVVKGVDMISPGLSERFVNQLLVRDLNKTESTVSRISAVSQAIDAWQTSPWTGIGLGNYGPYTTSYDYSDSGRNNIVNNQYLELLAETGLAGLGAFLALIGFVFGRSYLLVKNGLDQKSKSLLAGLTAALVGMLVQYNFFSTLSIIHIWMTIGLLVALQNLLFKQKTAEL